MSSTNAVRRLLDTEVVESSPLGGGLSAVVTADGRRVVAKHSIGTGATDAEAAGLRWLAETRDVDVPEVYGHDQDWLLIQHVERAAPTVEAAAAFGRGLAALHLRGAPSFGSPPPSGPVDAWIGPAPMRNVSEDAWPAFYARHRVEPYVRTARDQGALSAGQARMITQVCEHIDSIAGPTEPPARVHGDAWSGNLHWGPGGLWLLDPAAHGGHRETDLAMMRLFGAPLLEHILDAYSDAAAGAGAALADGWRERVGLHQLFPLLVHTVQFGGGYASQAVAAARSALALR